MARLPVLMETLRKLYLYSGNECAFPACRARLFNDDGVYIAQLAHIEAAEEGGPRYNLSQTDEGRRHYNNLLHLCYDHHKITDGVEYTVERMREIKAGHESRFGENAVLRMRDALQDLTESEHVTGSFTLNQLFDVLDWEKGDEEVEFTANKLKAFADRLSDLPREHRSILSVILKRGRSEWYSRDNFKISIHELESRLGMAWEDLHPRLEMLETHNFIEIDVEYSDVPTVQTATFLDLDGLEAWSLVKEFSSKAGVKVDEIVVALNFGVLD